MVLTLSRSGMSSGIERLELRLAAVGELDHVARQRLGALAAVGPVRADEGLDADALGSLHHLGDLGLSVSVMKRLMATTGGTPNLRTFSRWRVEVVAALGDGRDVLVA